MKLILGVDSISYPLTGIGRYALVLAKALQESTDLDVRFRALGRWVENPVDLASPARPSSLIRRNMHLIPFRGLVRRVYSEFNRARLNRDIRLMQGYMYHSPNFVLIPFNGPKIATIHDLSVIHYPEFHPEERVKYLSKEIPSTVSLADHIIADSEYVKSDLIETYKLPEERVSVTYFGVDPTYRPRGQVDVQTVLAEHGLNYRGFLLCVSTVEPRKNIDTLIASFSAMPEHLQRQFPLVIIGGKGWRSESTHKSLASLVESGRARYLGYVPESDLPLFYSAAKLFVYPTFFEGFGLPVLEAMASGTPVITSNCTSLPEVAGDAACLVDPHDPTALTEHIVEFLENSALCAELSTKGLAQAAKFTWESTVCNTIEIYRKVYFQFYGNL